jgi:hypothetical protein
MPTHPRPVPQPTKRHRIRPLVALVALGACVTLAACGSSGGGSSAASKSSAGATTKGRGPGSGQFTALRSCLQKQGITLPAPPSGTTRQPGGPGAGAPGGGAGGFQLPKGVSQTQYQAALKKCGAGNFAGGRAAGFNSPTARTALVKYAACLRQSGVNVPAPNTTGKGPVFNTKGIDTSSSKFKAAQSKCQSDLKGAFGGGGPSGGAPPAGATNGAPPSGVAPPGGEGTAG